MEQTGNDDGITWSSNHDANRRLQDLDIGLSSPRETRPVLTATPPPTWSQPVQAPTAPRPAGGSVIVDGLGTILAFDQRMESLTGWAAWEVVGQSKDLGVYAPPDQWGRRPYIQRPLFDGNLLPVEGGRETELTLTCRDGAHLSVEAFVTPLPGRGDRLMLEVRRVLAKIGGSGVDVSDQDPVTQLMGATLFQRALSDAFDSALTGGHPFALLFVDVDHLDEINERHGHERGDDVLRHVAGILRACTRHSDAVARLAADDFGVLLTGAGRGDARHVGGRIRRAIEMFRFRGTVSESVLPVTASIGVACFPADGGSPGELLRRAKDALDEVHRMGRNRVWCYVRRPRVPVLTPVYFDGPAGHLLGTSRDLSNSGVFVESFDELPLGMRLGLAFRLPGHSAPIRVIGRVARVVPHAEASSETPGIGIEFERYSEEDRHRLEEFLHQEEP